MDKKVRYLLSEDELRKLAEASAKEMMKQYLDEKRKEEGRTRFALPKNFFPHTAGRKQRLNAKPSLPMRKRLSCAGNLLKI